MIHYVLLPNNIVGSEQCVAKVQPIGTVNQEAVVEDMLARGFPMEKADVLKVLESYHEAIIRSVLDGKNVVTPFGIFRVSIRGRFDGLADGFDPARHQIVLRSSPGKLLRRLVRDQARVVKEETVERRPNLLEYNDTLSRTRNSTLTPGGPGLLVGHRLQFDPADPQQGVFFLSLAGATTRAEVIVKNRPGETIFIVPSLAPGEYALEVRVKFDGCTELRSGVLKESLIVS